MVELHDKQDETFRKMEAILMYLGRQQISEIDRMTINEMESRCEELLKIHEDLGPKGVF